jgi:hypothetical protein
MCIQGFGGQKGMITLRRSRSKWEDNIKIDLQEVGSGSEQGQLVGSCECSNEPSGSIKCGEFLD